MSTLREAAQGIVNAIPPVPEHEVVWLMRARVDALKSAIAQPDECPDCEEMAKQRDHYREQSRANSTSQLAEELSGALARIERLERALEAWVRHADYHSADNREWTSTGGATLLAEARRLTDEARK